MFNEALKSILNFCYFSPGELSIIEARLKHKLLKKNEFLLKEGNICQSFYFLNKGGCIHFFTPEEGIDVVLNLYVEHDWLTDYQSFTSQKPSVNNIQAFEDCEFVELDVHSLHELIQSSQSFFGIGRLFQVMQYGEFSNNMQSPEENYKALLDKRPKLIRKFPLKYIASYLRIAPETLSRIRRRIQ